MLLSKAKPLVRGYLFSWLAPHFQHNFQRVCHSRSCPYWNPSAEAKSNQLSAQYISSALGKMLQLAIKVTQGAGGLSINPLLTIRGFVHNDSPVFALFHDYNLRQYEDNIAEYMDYASARMLQLFRERCWIALRRKCERPNNFTCKDRSAFCFISADNMFC